MPEELLTVTEAARRLRCHVDTVRKLIAVGRLPAQDIGTPQRPTYRIPADALADLAVRPRGRPGKG